MNLLSDAKAWKQIRQHTKRIPIEDAPVKTYPFGVSPLEWSIFVFILACVAVFLAVLGVLDFAGKWLGWGDLR